MLGFITGITLMFVGFMFLNDTLGILGTGIVFYIVYRKATQK